MITVPSVGPHDVTHPPAGQRSVPACPHFTAPEIPMSSPTDVVLEALAQGTTIAATAASHGWTPRSVLALARTQPGWSVDTATDTVEISQHDPDAEPGAEPELQPAAPQIAAVIAAQMGCTLGEDPQAQIDEALAVLRQIGAEALKVHAAVHEAYCGVLRLQHSLPKPKPSKDTRLLDAAGIQTKDVRNWAKGKGIEVGIHGRLPVSVIEQYMAARQADAE